MADHSIAVVYKNHKLVFFKWFNPGDFTFPPFSSGSGGPTSVGNATADIVYTDTTQGGYSVTTNGTANTWSQFDPPLGFGGVDPSPNNVSVAALATPIDIDITDPANPKAVRTTELFAVQAGSTMLSYSPDRGATWQQVQMAPFADRVPRAASPGFYAVGSGQVILLNAADNDPVHDGIWYCNNATNSGTLNPNPTWTRLVSFGGTGLGGGWMGVSASQIMYAQKIDTTGGDTWAFNAVGTGGGGASTWATVQFTGNMPDRFLIRAVNDQLMFAIERWQNLVLMIDPVNGANDVKPSALGEIWDFLPLDESTWIAAGTTTGTSDVVVFRTQDAGVSWSQVATIPSAYGFAATGTADTYWYLCAPDLADRSEVYLAGSPHGDMQQTLYVSHDGGASFVATPNLADQQNAADGSYYASAPPGFPSVVLPVTVRAVRVGASIIG